MGQPIPGVTVQVKGTTRGTTTDMDGHFELPSDNRREAKLALSFIGMKSQEHTWNGLPLSIVMEEDAHQMEDVVVTGYQVINKRALTSAVTTVKAEDIIRPDALSIDQMLEGQIPDMMFMSNSGEAGVAPKIRIRGTSSIIGNREPLWVVDGIVVKDPVQISAEELNDPDYVNRIGNAIAGLNPQDIERLDILKDASATALYGSQAANGVIVITTKRGRVGKPVIRYSNSFNYKLRPRYSDRSVDVMNSKERIQFSRELFRDHYQYEAMSSPVGYEGLLIDLYNGTITDDEFATKVAYLETLNTDWFDLLTHDSFSQQHTVSMSGGSEQMSYYASLGYNDTDDVVNDQKNKRYSATLNLDANFTNWLSASFGLIGNISKRNYYQSSLAPVQYAYTASRAIPAYTEDGKYYYYEKKESHYVGYNYNILNELENSSVRQDGSSLTLNANFKFAFNDWLSANAIASYTTQTTDIESYWGDKTFYITRLRGVEYGEDILYPESSLCPQGGEFSTDHTRRNNWTMRLQVDWNKYFGAEEKHNFNGTVGYEMTSSRYKGYSRTDRGYYPDRGLSFVSNLDLEKYTSYAAWMAGNVPFLTDDLANTISEYASMTYGYDGMLYLNANARIDGSNRFGDQSNSKMLPVWSVSASFNFKEAWLEKWEWLNFITLKASYGFQGNMVDSESPVMTIKKNPLNDYYNEFTASAQNNPNPNLKWERTNSYNIGLEAGFWDNRIKFEASLYFKRTKNAFMTKTISTVNGFKSYVVNGGDISNDGYSVALDITPVMNRNWRWTLSTNFSRSINEVKTLPAGETYELEDFLNGTAVVKGKPVGTFYSYKFLGLSPVNGGPLFDDYGDHWEDLSGLSKYDTFTRVLEASGNREPYMSGGVTSQLRYKRLRLNVSLAYSLGAKTRLFSMFGADSSNGQGVYDANDIRPEWNMSRDYLNRWQHPGDESHTHIPAIIAKGHAAYFDYQNHWSANMTDEGIVKIADSYWDMYDYSNIRVASANYLKCNNIGITYEVPEKWLKNYRLSRLEITLSGSNLFTLCDSKLKGQTPTQGGFTTIQLSDRPSYSLGLNVSF